jgi:DNA repair exonuclease SbcCD ATPase subunit
VKLERDKSMAEARVKELETNLRQIATAPAASTSKIPNRHGRARSSSMNFGMNQELVDVRAALSKKETDLCSANEHLARVQAELTRADNEKIALEKRMQLQLNEMQACLEEKEDELEYVRGQQGDGSASARREEELLERVEEDEARINALEMQLRDNSEVERMRQQSRKTEARLVEEAKKAKEWRVALAREKEEALKELEDARAEMGKIVKDKEALSATARCRVFSSASDSQLPLINLQGAREPAGSSRVCLGSSS